MPRVISEFVEVPEPGAPYGVKGIGELATIAATPAIVAALRAATGRALNRVPSRPTTCSASALLRRAPAGRRSPTSRASRPIPEYHGLGLGQQELMKAR